jgi:hypothetical protein
VGYAVFEHDRCQSSVVRLLSDDSMLAHQVEPLWEDAWRFVEKQEDALSALN